MKKRLFHAAIFLAVICFLFLTGCSKGGGDAASSGGNASSPPPASASNISGMVTHNGAGEDGVTVYFRDALGKLITSTTTSGGGAYFASVTFKDNNARVDITFHKDGGGYVDSIKTITVNNGSSYVVNGSV